jgi:N-acetylmuramic acid 6-phosphate (MurNAc-6-P) etherase
VELAIEVEVGPEVIAGSTRMKAGTAQKLVHELHLDDLPWSGSARRSET